MNYFTLVLGLAVMSASADRTTEILIQAEDMQGADSKDVSRQQASGHRSVHLYTGDRLYTELCFIQDTKFTVNEIGYSNDGQSDRILVTLDKLLIDEFQTVSFSDGGTGWNRFRSHQSNFSSVSEGRHSLTVTVVESDKYGVEIDFIKLSVNNSQGANSVSCKSFCFEDISFPFSQQKVSPSDSARAVQRSVQTKCAEEDNINIPVFHENASKLEFVVTASLPKYRSFQNNRSPDWTNCRMYGPFWKYTDIIFSKDHTRQTETSTLHITQVTPGFDRTRQVSIIEVDFELEGPKAGEMDSEIGAHISIQDISYDGVLTFQFQYLNRYDRWSDKQDRTVQPLERNIEFVTPDFSFREGKGNKIRIEVFADLGSTYNLTIGAIRMRKRDLRPDRSTTLYEDGVIIIEGVDQDMWWRINETMSVTIRGEKQTFQNNDYIRIYRKVPWAQSSFSQVFVLYQDANIRLIPLTPHGLDWIPFGSSVIIGQTDPQSNRPCAPISHLDIDPNLLKITIFFLDRNVISLTIQTTMSETQLHVSGSHFMRDFNVYPFFTFRSMYVSDDNNDVDHISSDISKPNKINEQWNELRGNFFAFYRQCISKHNTQSPDISIRILS